MFNLRQYPKPHINSEFQNKINSILLGLYDPKRVFYICSSGGCGSTVIFNYLANFGKVFHIHDRYPPEKLCYVGNDNSKIDTYSEWFNTTEIPADQLNNYTVIFVYRNPLDVIYSRFATMNGPNIPHLQHIKCNNGGNIHLKNVLIRKQDLYGLEEFYDNYTIPKKRNYNIYCVKYENFFDNISLFNHVLNVPDFPILYPKKREIKKNIHFVNQLVGIYFSLLVKMNNMSFIELIKPICDDDDNHNV